MPSTTPASPPRPAEAGLLAALAAILLWSTSAVVTANAVRALPPLAVSAVSFTVAAAVGLVADTVRGRLGRLSAPPPVILLGLFGITSYYLSYALAFSLTDAIEANLLNYLWPLLTVLFSAPLLRTPLPRTAVPAALLGMVGAAIVVTGGRRLAFGPSHLAGDLLALYAGVTWALFSNLLRRVGPSAHGRMTLFCLLTATVAWMAVVVSGTSLPHTPLQWLGPVYLGIGPLYLAFTCWDTAVQIGNLARIGLLSYLTPALSVLWLAIAGERLTFATTQGMILIFAAALLGTWPSAPRGSNKNLTGS